MTSSLVSSAELNNQLNDSDLIILDVSQNRTANDLQIKGARYFDLKHDFSDPGSSFPNTFPSTQQFERSTRKLGINSDSRIVVYDNIGIFNAPRVWWMFRSMGFENISVLDGGLPAWLEAGFETEIKSDKTFTEGNFEATLKTKQVRLIDFVQDNLVSNSCLLVDARSSGRFQGTEPEPREGLRSGSIPHSKNIPFKDVLANGHFKSKEELQEIFKEIHSEDKSLVFTCGSGVTACVILLAYELAYEGNTSVYDGSWTEWATLKS